MVWAPYSSEINIPDSHPGCGGDLGHMFGSHSQPILSAADAVLIFGTTVLPRLLGLNAYESGKNLPQLTLSALAPALDRQMLADEHAAATRRRRADQVKEHARASKFAVFNNRSYRILKYNQQQYGLTSDRRGISPYPEIFDLNTPTLLFDVRAQPQGVPAVRMEGLAEIAPALDRAFEDKWPFFTDLVLMSDL
jgi:thiamine pyrophosphate-dependent acetolactate synthase large subunit-like protein